MTSVKMCKITTPRTILTWGIPLIIIASYSLLTAQADLSLAIPILVGDTACVILLLAVTLYTGEKITINWSPGIVIIIAATLRLLFLFRQPELSDDIYRYVFDGLQSLMGHNPYAMAPADIAQETEELAYLLLTPVLHPWYALYLVCLLLFVPGPAGLTLSWSVFLSYQVLIPYNILGEWVENDVTSISPFTIGPRRLIRHEI